MQTKPVSYIPQNMALFRNDFRIVLFFMSSLFSVLISFVRPASVQRTFTSYRVLSLKHSLACRMRTLASVQTPNRYCICNDVQRFGWSVVVER